MALTNKQRVFVEEYLATWNATEAARRAGYAYPNVEGTRLLVNDSIAAEVKQRLTDKVMTADEVLVRLAEQARSAQSEYLTPQGVDLRKLIADGKAHLIKGIKETKYGRDIEFYDAQAALVHIGKHHKLFTDKIEMEHGGSIEITPDQRAQALKELDEWKQKKSAEMSSG